MTNGPHIVIRWFEARTAAIDSYRPRFTPGSGIGFQTRMSIPAGSQLIVWCSIAQAAGSACRAGSRSVPD